LIETVLTRIASGEALRSICRDEGMPEVSQIMRLRISDPEFAKQYTHAREMQAEVFGDELVEIVDDGRNDWIEKHGKDGELKGYEFNGENVARSRLRFDQRRWWMSKVLPKVYGDKIEHTGEVGIKRILVPNRTQTEVSQPPESPDFE
jgi:hypothetical protein